MARQDHISRLHGFQGVVVQRLIVKLILLCQNLLENGSEPHDLDRQILGPEVEERSEQAGKLKEGNLFPNIRILNPVGEKVRPSDGNDRQVFALSKKIIRFAVRDWLRETPLFLSTRARAYGTIEVEKIDGFIINKQRAILRVGEPGFEVDRESRVELVSQGGEHGVIEDVVALPLHVADGIFLLRSVDKRPDHGPRARYDLVLGDVSEQEYGAEKHEIKEEKGNESSARFGLMSLEDHKA